MSIEMIIVILLYLLITLYLGYRGYKETKTATDYLLAGRGAHPVIMSLSYGSTFISTSAIVGFGGIASQFGLSMLWLTFFNIMVGIFVAFVFIGKRVRKIGHEMDAHTFPELIGKKYNSVFLQKFSGLLIFLFMPIYAAAVLIGGAKFLQITFTINFDLALFIFAIIVVAYVIAGGMKGVMYTDALQGLIMILGTIFLIAAAYFMLGGNPHKDLSKTYNEIKDRISTPQKKQEFLKDYLQKNYQLSLTTDQIAKIDQKIPAIIKDKEKSKKFSAALKEVSPETNLEEAKLNKVMNRFFYSSIEENDIKKNEKLGFIGWDQTPKSFSNAWWLLFSTFVLGVGIGVLAQPQLVVRFMTVRSDKELNRGVGIGGIFILIMTGGSFVVGALSNLHFFNSPDYNTTAIAASLGNVDEIIPNYINAFMPKWFVTVFLLTLLAAAMSTLSSQFHAIGTAFSRDILRLGIGKTEVDSKTIFWTKIGIIIGLVLTIILGYSLGESVIARGTAIFFGIAAASFLPLFIGALYSKKVNKTGALASFTAGTLSSLIWLVFFQLSTANAVGICKAIFGKPALTMVSAEIGGKMTLIPTTWSFVDALVIGLPISFIALVLGCLLSKKKA